MISPFAIVSLLYLWVVIFAFYVHVPMFKGTGISALSTLCFIGGNALKSEKLECVYSRGRVSISSSSGVLRKSDADPD